MGDDAHVAHGFSLRDLDRMTHAAAIADRSRALDYADKMAIAWSAIAEALVAAAEPPDRQALVRVGWQAIYRTVRDDYRSHGRNDDGEVMPRFAMFWFSPVTHDSPENWIVEAVAVGQVLDTLTPIYRDAMVALAVHDDYLRAARSLGIEYKAFVARIGVARKRLLTLWHEGEAPHRVYYADRRVESHSVTLATHCQNNHEWTPENTYIRHRMLRGKPHKSRVCRACESERSARRHRERVA